MTRKVYTDVFKNQLKQTDHEYIFELPLGEFMDEWNNRHYGNFVVLTEEGNFYAMANDVNHGRNLFREYVIILGMK